MRTELSRRDLVRLLGVAGGALWLDRDALARARDAVLPPTPAAPDEAFWAAVRDQFVMPKELAVLNAANLCPSSPPVLESLYKATREMDRDPSPAYREEMHDAKEVTRKLLAGFLGVTPEEIVITRNTSESNNLVSNGLDLRAGDEVLLFSDNHPSNDVAWKQKAKPFGYAGRDVRLVNVHPGAEDDRDDFHTAVTP